MKFSAREDIDAPISEVFAIIADFDGHERAAMRRGVRVERLDSLTTDGPGAVWEAEVGFRGRMRDITVELASYEPPEIVTYVFESSGVRGSFALELVAMSAKRTRMAVALDMRPQNFSGRLLLQSLKLVKPSLTRRFKSRVAAYAAQLGSGRVA